MCLLSVILNSAKIFVSIGIVVFSYKYLKSKKETKYRNQIAKTATSPNHLAQIASIKERGIKEAKDAEERVHQAKVRATESENLTEMYSDFVIGGTILLSIVEIISSVQYLFM